MYLLNWILIYVFRHYFKTTSIFLPGDNKEICLISFEETCIWESLTSLTIKLFELILIDFDFGRRLLSIDGFAGEPMKKEQNYPFKEL